MKLYDIILTANANLLRSKLRTFLTILAIFIGALTLSLTTGIGSGISDYINRQLGNLGTKDQLIIRANQDAGAGLSSGPKKYDPSRKSIAAGFGPSMVVLTEADLTKIRAHSGVVSVEPQQSVSPDYIQGLATTKYSVTISPIARGTQLDLAAGTGVDSTATAPQIVLPISYVSSLGYKDSADAIGKAVTIAITSAGGHQTTQTATVTGVQQKGLVGSDGVSANPALVTALFNAQTVGLPEASKQQYQLAIAMIDPKLSSTQVTQLKSDLKTQGYTAQTIQDTVGIFKSVINGIIAVLNAFGVIALLAASFGIVNTLLMSVQERTKEIGLMKAMGMNAKRIFLLFSLEAVLIGFWGSLIGVIVAEVIGTAANQIVSTGFLKDLPGLHLLIFPVKNVAETMLLIMAIAFLAGTLPAWRASRQSPIDALRYE